MSPAPSDSGSPFPLSASTDRVRARVLRTCMPVFSEKGLGGTTLEDLARAASMPLGEVAQRFPSPEAALSAALTRTMMEFGALQRRSTGERGWDLITTYLNVVRPGADRENLTDIYVHAVRAALDPASPLRDWLTTRFDEFSQGIAEAVSTGIEDGTIRPDADPERITRLLLSFVDGVSVEWVVHHDRKEVSSQLDEFLGFLKAHYGTASTGATA